MMSLTERLNEYLTVRRSFGYDLSTTERVLRRFLGFAEDSAATRISTDLFLNWMKHFGSANQHTWAARLGMVRSFAIWLRSLEPQHEIPPLGLISGRYRRSQPFIYSDDQIVQIITTAARLPSTYGLRGATCATLFGLIAVTGLRISEALGLQDKDFDSHEKTLTIRQGKNGKSRWVPICESTARHLTTYQQQRNRIASSSSHSVFQWEGGGPATDCAVRYNFARVCQQIGLRPATRFHRHGRGPRIHDLRHTFAVQTMMDWYRQGLNPDQEMTKLSTYLGHAEPSHTYWYLEAVPELLELASQRVTGSAGWGATR